MLIQTILFTKLNLIFFKELNIIMAFKKVKVTCKLKEIYEIY